MLKVLSIIVFVALGFWACDDNKESINQEITDESSFGADSTLLSNLYLEIVSLSTQDDCIDSTLWLYTPIGSKACGGPTGYIAYSIEIDVDVFLDKVDFYSQQQAIYNQKWGVFSTCDVPPSPIGVSCNNGSPVLIYQ